MNCTKEPAFINRSRELAALSDWIAERPENLLFIYGPKYVEMMAEMERSHFAP
ncbi:hypothetical protein [Desulforhabdus amnigena]|jgi:hypothetical protein|uniref:Uncharacterized protein n=1 Tax=Desulforhabdus amnigena TaxID=40218 RepID=A0A9W6D3J8_9BACT|nr:hypothetical protein [Desulforhabdus amnigena]NLJ27074.1 hypothetical protein [Deltaproteobacteria bacterium]GLI33535.1 hypothetical protein DAMNIGENAA_09680 [Desulforhabdus amnigena]